jgi:Flp pilus assembly protein TadB
MKSKKYPYKDGFATVLEISADTGIKRITLYRRLQAVGGVMSEEILTPPTGPGAHVKLCCSEGTPLIDIARRKGLCISTVMSRYARGYRSKWQLGAKVNK